MFYFIGVFTPEDSMQGRSQEFAKGETKEGVWGRKFQQGPGAELVGIWGLLRPQKPETC